MNCHMSLPVTFVMCLKFYSLYPLGSLASRDLKAITLAGGGNLIKSVFFLSSLIGVNLK